MKTNFKLAIAAISFCCVSSCQKQHSIPGDVTESDYFQAGAESLTMDSRASTSHRRRIDSTDFVNCVDNKYFPLKPGTIRYYKQVSREEGELLKRDIKVEVTKNTKKILGVSCVVVHDVVSEEGTITEDTYDWYAQDKQGNVWYFGEETRKLEDGQWITTGSWEAGVDGAVAGIIMWGNPENHIGQLYRQEYLKDSAEDRGRVVNVSSTVAIQLGTYTKCIVIEETTPLEPRLLEYKSYAPGIGNISTVLNRGGMEHEELVRIVN